MNKEELRKKVIEMDARAQYLREQILQESEEVEQVE